MYPPAGRPPQHGQPEEPWQQGGTYGSPSSARGHAQSASDPSAAPWRGGGQPEETYPQPYPDYPQPSGGTYSSGYDRSLGERGSYPPPGYGAPQSPASGYGPTPASSSSGYGAPQSPASGYGPTPASPSSGYGAPQSPASGYGPTPASPSSGYGAPQSPASGYGAGPGEHGHYGQTTGGTPFPGYDTQPGGPAPRKKSKALLILGIVLGAFLLFCVGGGTLIALSGDAETDDPSTVASGPASPDADESTGESETVHGDLDKFQKGDCLTISSDNDIEEAECGAPGAYRVLLRKNGTTSQSACENTEATEWLFQDATIGTKKDFVLCVARVD